MSPGDFNAEQIHQPGHTVSFLAGDHEIGRLFAGPGEFGPDAAIIGDQRPLWHARPIGANAIVEGIGATRIDGVAFMIDPFDVRAEAHAAGKVQRDMHAEPAIDRRRVNQPRKHRLSGKAEIVALGENERRHLVGRVTFDAARQRLRAKAGRIDHCVESHRARIAAAELHLPLRRYEGHALDRRLERDRAAAILQFAPQRQHVAMAVEHAGFR